MKEDRYRQWDHLMDLLAAEVAERLADDVQRAPLATSDEPPAEAPPAPPSGKAALDQRVEPPCPPGPEGERPQPDETEDEPEWNKKEIAHEPPPGPPMQSHTARLLSRLAVGLLALLVIINIPINRQGTTLATAMPDRRALIFRDGLVVKEEDDPEIYVYQDGAFRWISSLKAFETGGYTWADVHVVEDGFLDPHDIGRPIHAVVSCHDSPHIFRVEDGVKRWIVDIEAFDAEGHVWEDVSFVPCAELRAIPDEETIPPGHGPPPEP